MTRHETEQANREAERLLIELGQGTESAMEGLYSLISAPVYSYALSVLADHADAEDVLHDTVVRVYTHAARYRPDGKPFAWVIRIAKNLCVDKLRERKRCIPDEPALAELALPASAEAEDRLTLESFLSELTPDEREIIVLHDISGFKFREIAKALGIPPPTAMTRYRRGMIKLKKKFGEGGEAG